MLAKILQTKTESRYVRKDEVKMIKLDKIINDNVKK